MKTPGGRFRPGALFSVCHFAMYAIGDEKARIIFRKKFRVHDQPGYRGERRSPDRASAKSGIDLSMPRDRPGFRLRSKDIWMPFHPAAYCVPLHTTVAGPWHLNIRK